MTTSVLRPQPALSVLIDNSTYFSFKQLAYFGELDADSLYNAGIFVESLVLADELNTAPTSIWQPGIDDPLFTDAGPCRQIAPARFGDDALLGVFERALLHSEQDCLDPAVLRYLEAGTADGKRAKALLKQWIKLARESPQDFHATVYSDPVLITDSASGHVVAGLADRKERFDSSKNVAQFLLRTNVAVEIAIALPSSALPYVPHSHRAAYVVHRLKKSAQLSHAVATILLRDLEGRERDMLTRIQNESPLQVLGLRPLGAETPLVLAVALSGATSPDEIPKHALAIRQTKEAQRYRHWVRELVDSIQTNEYDESAVEKRLNTYHEVDTARQILALELAKLYGTSKKDIVQTVSDVASAPDFEDLADGDVKNLKLFLAKEAIKGMPRLKQALTRRAVKRHVAFLIDLLKERKRRSRWNPLLVRVFGRGLSDAEIERLNVLRNAKQALGHAKSRSNK